MSNTEDRDTRTGKMVRAYSDACQKVIVLKDSIRTIRIELSSLERSLIEVDNDKGVGIFRFSDLGKLESLLVELSEVKSEKTELEDDLQRGGLHELIQKRRY